MFKFILVLLILSPSLASSGPWEDYLRDQGLDQFGQGEKLIPPPDPYSNPSGSSYNPQTGDNYYWSGTSIRGYNTQTGQNWGVTVDSDGDMRGFNSRMEAITYDSETGRYVNHNTGEIRTIPSLLLGE